jgi:hypothetical protein
MLHQGISVQSAQGALRRDPARLRASLTCSPRHLSRARSPNRRRPPAAVPRPASWNVSAGQRPVGGGAQKHRPLAAVSNLLSRRGEQSKGGWPHLLASRADQRARDECPGFRVFTSCTRSRGFAKESKVILALGLLIVGLLLHRASRPLVLPPRTGRVVEIEIYRKRR